MPMKVYAPNVLDGCEGIRRELLYLSHSTNTNLKLDPLGVLKTCGRLLEKVHGLDRFPRVLLVTMKQMVETQENALRALFPHATELHLRWFGNIAGTNAFQEGGPQESDCFVTIGDYYANRKWMFEFFAREDEGITDPDELERYVIACGKLQMRGELAQAHGRARDPRRTKPCLHLHFGRVLPRWWEGRGVVLHQLRSTKGEAQARLYGLLMTAVDEYKNPRTAALLGVTKQAVGTWVNKQKPVPQRHEPRLIEICSFLSDRDPYRAADYQDRG